ncbi:nitroreductase family protein [Lachnoclostridium sp. Marseille-P6806]|uniref:nitroreductase family protein n=1 Tax=Lachnoclostridium sp. Marseille-P6806 TaxID=2364793 RepID=UPI001031D024|nr:nitroreductase family protein [Lachnoclostridium sp. Marseille-P6806]
MTAWSELIKSRKSVRSFDGSGLSTEDRETLEQYAAGITNPFHIPVRFVFLDADEYGLSSPVLTGEKLYVAGKTEKRPGAEAAFGYSFEKLVLYAWSLGIGTTWIGGTIRRELFERAAALVENEMMPCVSPLGYPAKQRSVRETLMRKGVHADSRMPADRLFFDGVPDVPLSEQEKAEISDLIEMVRWAPSAVNKQPWRIIRKDGRYHFYEKRDKGYVSDAAGDLQKIDVGIALCHFMTGLEERGERPEAVSRDPGIAVPEDMEYIVTVAM